MRSPRPWHRPALRSALLALGLVAAGAACAHPGAPRSALAAYGRPTPAPLGCPRGEVVSVENASRAEVEVWERDRVSNANRLVGTVHAGERAEFPVAGGQENSYGTLAVPVGTFRAAVLEEVKRNVHVSRACVGS